MQPEIMKRPGLTAMALLLTMLLLAGTPMPAAAQGDTETVTAQAVITLPNGQQVSGTMVDRRTLGPEISSSWTFSGMLDGQPLVAAGTAIEHWQGDGKLAITITSITELTVNGSPRATNPDGSPGYPPALLQTIAIEQTGKGLVTVRGIPLAIGGDLQPPGSGDLSYVVTNAGQGHQQVARLPNTGSLNAAGTTGWAPLTLAALGLGVLLAAGVRALRPPRQP